jgi:hypothetical protein
VEGGEMSRVEEKARFLREAEAMYEELLLSALSITYSH